MKIIVIKYFFQNLSLSLHAGSEWAERGECGCEWLPTVAGKSAFFPNFFLFSCKCFVCFVFFRYFVFLVFVKIVCFQHFCWEAWRLQTKWFLKI